MFLSLRSDYVFAVESKTRENDRLSRQVENYLALLSDLVTKLFSPAHRHRRNNFLGALKSQNTFAL